MTTIVLVVLLLIKHIFAEELKPQDETITKLDLSNKGLTSLKEYDFSQYPLLEEIDLSNNEIEHIKEKTFEKNTKLVKLNLSGNTKLQIPKYSTLLISSIQELNLSNCNIQKFSQNIFDGLRYLKIIDLGNNPIKKKSFSVRALHTIESLQKLIIPEQNERLLKELCKNFNINIEISNQDETKPVECKDYVTGTEDDEDYDYDDEEEDAESSVAFKATGIEIPPVDSLSTNGNEKNDTTQNENSETPAKTDLNTSLSETDASKTAVAADLKEIIKVDNTSLVENPPPAASEKPHLEPREAELKKIADTNTTENVIKLNITENAEIPHLEPRDGNETKFSVTTELLPQSRISTANINNTNNQSLPEEINKESRAPDLRVAVPANGTALKETEHQDMAKTNMSEKMRISPNTDDKETGKVAEVTESSNTGSTILIVLVIAVVIAGLAAFGYKFYKNKTYRESDQTDRELKEIVATKSISDDPVRDITEQEPLMNNHVTKENGDPKQNQSQAVSNHLSTGPYQPTTTTFKPIDQSN